MCFLDVRAAHVLELAQLLELSRGYEIVRLLAGQVLKNLLRMRVQVQFGVRLRLVRQDQAQAALLLR